MRKGFDICRGRYDQQRHLVPLSIQEKKERRKLDNTEIRFGVGTCLRPNLLIRFNCRDQKCNLFSFALIFCGMICNFY